MDSPRYASLYTSERGHAASVSARRNHLSVYIQAAIVGADIQEAGMGEPMDVKERGRGDGEGVCPPAACCTACLGRSCTACATPILKPGSRDER
ncbi:hypothetical protein BV20DRAFT_968620 [Pilatotrama ljubarskyi]|nr:hypothetical protein BV20DRAFT_968620 [Pilatotrama ljubarskyi]